MKKMKKKNPNDNLRQWVIHNTLTNRFLNRHARFVERVEDAYVYRSRECAEDLLVYPHERVIPYAAQLCW